MAGGIEDAPVRVQLSGGQRRRSGIAADAVFQINIHLGTLPQVLSLPKQDLIQNPGFLGVAPEGAAYHGAAGELPGHLVGGGAELLQRGLEQFQLLPGFRQLGLLAAPDLDLQHQHIAQQQRDQSDQQHRSENAVLKGPPDPTHHGSSSQICCHCSISASRSDAAETGS